MAVKERAATTMEGGRRSDGMKEDLETFSFLGGSIGAQSIIK